MLCGTYGNTGQLNSTQEQKLTKYADHLNCIFKKYFITVSSILCEVCAKHIPILNSFHITWVITDIFFKYSSVCRACSCGSLGFVPYFLPEQEAHICIYFSVLCFQRSQQLVPWWAVGLLRGRLAGDLTLYEPCKKAIAPLQYLSLS